jgi:hypothetical protein
MGMHNSRKLQLEQATLMAWGFMVYLLVEQWICLGSRLELIPKNRWISGVWPVLARNPGTTGHGFDLSQYMGRCKQAK